MSDELIDGIDAEVWRRQARFRHCVTTSPQIDHLNATGGIAISFAADRRGSVHLAFEGSQSKSLSIWTTRSRDGFLSAPKFKNELYSIRFVTSGFMVRNNREGAELLGRPGRATLLAFDEMIEDRASAEFAALTATVTRETILLACEALEGNKPQPLPNFLPVVDASSPSMLGLRQTLYTLQRRLQIGPIDSDFIFSLIEEILVYQIVSIWPKFGDEVGYPALTSNSRLKIAVDYIEANLARKITIAEIASISGFGVRSLQLSFRREFGCTPFQFIIGRRLERVHDLLQHYSGVLTIREIATQWGFAHMSDFSRRYRQRFGFAPTMARSRR